MTLVGPKVKISKMRRRKSRVMRLLLAAALAVAAVAVARGQDTDDVLQPHEVAVSVEGEIAPQTELDELTVDSAKQPNDDPDGEDGDELATQQPRLAYDYSTASHREQFFHYLGEMGLNVTAYIPACAYDTQWGEIWDALEAALVGSYEFLKLWAIVLWLLSIPLTRLLTALLEALLPHFLVALELVAEYIYDLDPVYQAGLVVAFVLAIICYRQGYVGRVRRQYLAFRREMRHRYREFVLSLNEKSRLAALALPHLVFLVGVYFIVFWSPPLVMELWDNPSLTVVLSVVIPLARSFRAIHRRRILQRREEEALAAGVVPPPTTLQRRLSASGASYNEWRVHEACLKYWVLWSIAVSVASVASLFIPSFLAAYVTVPTYWLNILLAWMHSPVARGDIALYTLLSPLVNPYANRIKDANDSDADGDARAQNNAANPAGLVMRALEVVGVMRQQHLHIMKDLWSQGPALGGLMFLFTPGFVTARGALLVGFGFPSYVTMGALADKRTRSYEWWLQYFTVAVIVDYLVTAIGESIAWLPLFYHAKLLLLMWLQFPYFRGAQKIFDATHTSVFLSARATPPATETVTNAEATTAT